MGLEGKLARWQQAGLIDASTRGRIEAYEAGQRKPVAFYALGGLGALTVGIGIVSVIAANWEAIGRAAKLGADLLLGALLASTLYAAQRRQERWLREVLAAIYYVFTLASIALLSQVYQLGGETWQALATWTASTLPLMTLVRSRFVGLLWLSGLGWTQAESLVAGFEYLDDTALASGSTLVNLAVIVGFATPPAYAAVTHWPRFRAGREALCAAWDDAIAVFALCAAFALGFVWYDELRERETLSFGVLAAAAVTAAFAAALPKLTTRPSPRALAGARALLLIAWLTLASGATFPRPAWPAVGALFQIALLASAAFTVLHQGRTRTFNALTAAIALRVLVVYFEVFGSMLDTGVGMISGGALTLMLAWLWRRKSAQLGARFAPPGSDHVA